MMRAKHKRGLDELDNSAVQRVVKRPRRISPKSRFQHTPLATPDNQIRLFELHRSAKDGTLELDLNTWPLQDCPPYFAISYVWGNPTECSLIRVNGKTFGTTANASYALRQIMHQRSVGSLKTTHFWMDSICIDQSSLEEKSKQVELMGEIYKNAEEVLACIGPQIDDSKLVIDVFRATDIMHFHTHSRKTDVPEEMNERFSAVWERFTSILEKEWEAQPSIPTLAAFHTHFSAAVLEFFNREYWWRIWIVQEIMLARSAKLLCGSEQVDITYFAPFFREEAYWGGMKWLTPWEESKMVMILNTSHHTKGVVSYKLGTRVPAGLCIRKLRDSKCADFRDRVYALLRLLHWGDSIVDDCDVEIKPDYTVTKFGLLVQIAEAMIPVKVKGVRLWDVMSNLYKSLQLTLADPEISGLINRRKTLPRDKAKVENTPDVSISDQPMLDWAAAFCFPLEASSDGLKLGGRYQLDQRTKRRLDSLTTPELQKLQLKAGDVAIGWICPEARAGDYLVNGVIRIDDPLAIPQLILRRTEWHAGRTFEIVGHAVLYYHVENRMPWPWFRMQFDVQDYIALVALRNHTLSDGFGADDLHQLLTISPIWAEFSSYAEIWEEDKADVELDGPVVMGYR